MSNAAKLLKYARAGNLDGIYEIVGGEEDEEDEEEEAEEEDYGGDDDGDEESGQQSKERDELLYKWLQIAGDFGSDEAYEAADDMLETSSLRYDDEQMVVGLIHLELGQKYLLGDEGLPKSHDRAQRHLDLAKEMEVHKTTDVGKTFDAFRKKVDAAGRTIFDTIFAAKKPAKAPAPAAPAPAAKKPAAPAPKKKKR